MSNAYLASMSEAELQDDLADLMRVVGYRVVHWRPGRRGTNEWSVPVTYDGKGWPDLVGFHTRTGVIVAVDCKSARGRATSEQTDWLRTMSACGVHVFLARPSNYHEVAETLETLASNAPTHINLNIDR
jgi:hypothetical protein